MNKLTAILAIFTLAALAQLTVQASETFAHEIESGGENLFHDMGHWFDGI